jgi:hypothetical protein
MRRKEEAVEFLPLLTCIDNLAGEVEAMML